MIGKIKKGKSFGGCIRYVMGKESKAKSIKNKQDNSKVKQNKSKP